VCGAAGVRVETPKDYLYSQCGLHGVHLLGRGVVITDCDSCRNKTTTVLQEAQLLQVLGMSIVLGAPGITGEQVRYLRKLFEMTQDEFARALGKTRRETVAEWESLETKRLFKTPYEELSLRVILMSLYGARVLESEYCCLSMQHRAAFANASSRFIERAPSLVSTRERSAPMEIRRPSRSMDWSPTHCAVC
jgi:transcriptional regulator with XRE-family HTH domain